MSKERAQEIRGYQSMIGILMYLMLGTRPDLAYAVGKLSRFSSNPAPEHFITIQRVLDYIYATRHFRLEYFRKSTEDRTLIYPIGMSDSDFAGDTSDRKSTSGYVFVLGYGAISWYSKKQTTVATSTLEAEYTALFAASKKAVWIRQFLQQIGVKDPPVIEVFCNNMGALAVAEGAESHFKSKHLDIQLHTI